MSLVTASSLRDRVKKYEESRQENISVDDMGRQVADALEWLSGEFPKVSARTADAGWSGVTYMGKEFEAKKLKPKDPMDGIQTLSEYNRETYPNGTHDFIKSKVVANKIRKAFKKALRGRGLKVAVEGSESTIYIIHISWK